MSIAIEKFDDRIYIQPAESVERTPYQPSHGERHRHGPASRRLVVKATTEVRESRDTVYVGAIVTIAGGPGREQDSGSHPRKRLRSYHSPNQQLLGSPAVTWDVLGESVLDRTLDRLRIFGVDHVSVISEDGL